MSNDNLIHFPVKCHKCNHVFWEEEIYWQHPDKGYTCLACSENFYSELNDIKILGHDNGD